MNNITHKRFCTY